MNDTPRFYEIEENFADRNIVWKTPEEMPGYYNELDLCICASAHEGTPRPVLESMHSGVPLISTDVGMVPESFGPKQKRFNIGDRGGISLRMTIYFLINRGFQSAAVRQLAVQAVLPGQQVLLLPSS